MMRLKIVISEYPERVVYQDSKFSGARRFIMLTLAKAPLELKHWLTRQLHEQLFRYETTIMCVIKTKPHPLHGGG